MTCSIAQLGVHPVRGKRAAAALDQPRNFMVHSEFAFSLERMKRNSHRLKIGFGGSADSTTSASGKV